VKNYFFLTFFTKTLNICSLCRFESYKKTTELSRNTLYIYGPTYDVYCWNAHQDDVRIYYYFYYYYNTIAHNAKNIIMYYFLGSTTSGFLFLKKRQLDGRVLDCQVSYFQRAQNNENWRSTYLPILSYRYAPTTGPGDINLNSQTDYNNNNNNNIIAPSTNGVILCL